MKVFAIIVCMLATAAGAAGAASDADSTRAQSALAAPLSQGLLLSRYPVVESRTAPTPNYLTFSLSPFTVQPYAPTSYFDAMLFGAGAGGTLGMFVGAIGNTLGLFDEQTTWAITGAAAAAGALYSTSRFKIRVGPDDWSTTPRPPSDR